MQSNISYPEGLNKALSFKNVDMTRSVNETFNRVKNDILVVNAEQPLAFTLGFRRPFIVFSTGLIRLLDFDELEAVVEHEAFHQRNMTHSSSLFYS